MGQLFLHLKKSVYIPGDAQGSPSSEIPANHDHPQNTPTRPLSVRNSAPSSSLPSSSFAHEQLPQSLNRQYTSLLHDPQLQETIHSLSNTRINTEDPGPEYGSVGGHDLPRALSTSTLDHPLSPTPAQSRVFASEGDDSYLHPTQSSSFSSTHSPRFASSFPLGRLTPSPSHSGIAHYAGNNVSIVNNSSQPLVPTSTSPSRRSRLGTLAARHPLMRVDTSSTSRSEQQRQPSPSRGPLLPQQQTHNSQSASRGPSSSRYLIPQLNLSGRELFEGTPFPTEPSSTTFTHRHHREEGERASGSSADSETRPAITNRGRLQRSALSPVEASQWPAIARLPPGPDSLDRQVGSPPSQIAIEINTPMGTRRPLVGKNII